MQMILKFTRLTIETIQLIYMHISNWISNNFLKLNDSKSQVIIIGTSSMVSECKSIASSINLGSSEIEFSSNVVNLGVTFDENLNFIDNIKNCTKGSFFILRNLRHIRHNFTKAGFESLIHAFVTSKTDYCNSLYVNLPESTLKLLRSIQNFAARLVCRRSLYCRITPVLKELHWLPISLRIEFKILLITYKAVHLSVPPYLVSQLKYKIKTSHDLRHYDNLLLKEPYSKSKISVRSFSICAPILWNKIPFYIRSSSTVSVFKKRLKTYLFTNREFK